MKTNIKYGLLTLAIAGLALAGVASAHGGPGEDKEPRERALHRCAEQYDADFCQDLQALRTEHREEAKALHQQYGVEEPTDRPERQERPADVCTDDMTVADCRDAREAAHKEAAEQRCVETNSAEFCAAWSALRAEHREEVQALFDEAGYQAPERPKGPGGPGRH